MTLIDTSSWVEALRKDGNEDVRERVRKIMTSGKAACCDMVLLELWNGARGEYEKKKLMKLENEIRCVPTTEEVWKLARELARKCRTAGYTLPSSDIVIAACAKFHQMRIEQCDQHFRQIQDAGKF